MPRIAFQRVKGTRGAFQRGRLRAASLPGYGLLKLSSIFRYFLYTNHWRGEKPPPYRQARLNSRNPTNITISATHRQWQMQHPIRKLPGWHASRIFNRDLLDLPGISARGFKTKPKSLGLARDSPAGSVLSWPEQRSVATLSNGPARGLNLLKKILASTLRAFPARQARPVNPVGGEGAWVGGSSWCALPSS
jgi:hypothetical protein